VNLNCIVWTLFVSVIFSLPTTLPVTKNTMNYAAVITGSIALLALIWYFVDGRRHYHGPRGNAGKIAKSATVVEGEGEKSEKGSVEDKNEEGITVSQEISS